MPSIRVRANYALRSAAHSTRLAAAVIALVCLVLIVPVQTRIDSLRAGLVRENVMPTQMPLSAAASAALGGFRGLAVDLLWIQADNMINERQFYQLMTYYKVISTLQPNFPTVWTYNAWNLAYNISAEWGQPDEKWVWIKKGIELGREGLVYNPNSEELNFYVGWLFFNKVAANPYFTAKLFEEQGTEPYLEAYGFFQKAVDVGFAQGETNVRAGSFALLTLFLHGEAVLKTGNVPEAMRFFDRAEQGTKDLAAQFPDDAAVLTLLDRIRRTKARLQEQ